MVGLKIGRRYFEIDDTDVVLYNGACWQLMTQTYFDGWHSTCPTMSKTMCSKFVKKNILVHFKTENEYETTDGRKFGLYYYRFDIDNLKAYLSK